MSRIVLTEGVVGGFVPATARQSIILDVEDDGSINFTHNILRKGTRDDYSTLTSPKQFTASATVSKFVDELVAAFRTLPRENPPGSEDIYGFDVSISIDYAPEGGQKFRWENRPNSGCVASDSSVVPSDEEKAKFKHYVDRLINLAKTHAVVEG
ncbi:hypothetical protein BJ742DRAFT_783157 [Cladochytrium replicatum]|nr:hypothetical protein BJ742DRAFT_783157 [Cladochytrium replicatum]